MARLIGSPEAWAETVDVSDEQAMEKLAEKVAAEYGVVDVLVNNAGIGLSGSFFDTTAEDWKKVLDVNLWGVIHGCRLFGKQMAERGQGGHIVNTASAAAYQPSKALPAYSTSKAAVLMLSECLRAELAGAGHRRLGDLPRLRQHQHHLDRALRRGRRGRGEAAPEAGRHGCTGCATTRRRRSPTRSCGRSCATRRSCRSPRRRAAPGSCPGSRPGRCARSPGWSRRFEPGAAGGRRGRNDGGGQGGGGQGAARRADARSG